MCNQNTVGRFFALRRTGYKTSPYVISEEFETRDQAIAWALNTHTSYAICEVIGEVQTELSCKQTVCLYGEHKCV